jgi:hypothetical protein
VCKDGVFEDGVGVEAEAASVPRHVVRNPLAAPSLNLKKTIGSQLRAHEGDMKRLKKLRSTPVISGEVKGKIAEDGI